MTDRTQHFAVASLLCFLLASGASPASALPFASDPTEETEHDPKDFHVFWRDSLRLETYDETVKLRIGGRLNFDAMWSAEDDDLEDFVLDDGGTPADPSDDDTGKIEDGVEMRRARMYLSGQVYDNVGFKIQFDFAGGDADFADVYMELMDCPLGDFYVGQFKEPFSLEWQTSSNEITFLERSLANALSPARSSGIMLRNHVADDRLTFGVAAVRATDSSAIDVGDGDYVYTARVTGVVYEDTESASVIHLGASGSYRLMDEFRYRSRPEAHLAPYLVDTGNIAADSALHYGVEAAAIYGPFAVSGEYIMATVDAEAGSDPDYQGHYVQASYFLTGEHHRYDKSWGVFKYPKVDDPFDLGEEDGGLGAWEVALRYSGLDLSDTDDGELHDVTAGLNWYLNNNARVMFNYVFADLDDVGDAHIGLVRFQLHF